MKAGDLIKELEKVPYDTEVDVQEGNSLASIDDWHLIVRDGKHVQETTFVLEIM